MDEKNKEILAKCITWYEKYSEVSREIHKEAAEEVRFNSVAAIAGNKPKFKKYDLARFKEGEYSTKNYVFFVTVPSYSPKFDSEAEKIDYKSLRLGSWHYYGSLMQISGNQLRHVKERKMSGDELKPLEEIVK